MFYLYIYVALAISKFFFCLLSTHSRNSRSGSQTKKLQVKRPATEPSFILALQSVHKENTLSQARAAPP